MGSRYGVTLFYGFYLEENDILTLMRQVEKYQPTEEAYGKFFQAHWNSFKQDENFDEHNEDDWYRWLYLTRDCILTEIRSCLDLSGPVRFAILSD